MRFPFFLVAVGILALAARRSCAEDLTTLDGKKYADITDISKYPKQVYFTSNSNRIGVAITNLPEDFKERHGIIKAAMPHPTSDGAALFLSAPKLTEADGKTFEETKAKAEAGDSQAQYEIGMDYSVGIGVSKNLVEAAKWYRKAADQGNPRAQCSLADCYSYGQGVDKNTEEAVKWFRKAAEQGDESGEHSLAMCYDSGEGVVKDFVEAVKWYRKAAEQGNYDGQIAIAQCYRDGKGGYPKNPIEAEKWYQKALGVVSQETDPKWLEDTKLKAENGDLTAMTALGDVFYKKWRKELSGFLSTNNAPLDSTTGLPTETISATNSVNYCMSMDWYRKAARMGNTNAMWKIVERDDSGEFKGINPSTGLIISKEGFSWLQELAKKGDAEAILEVNSFDSPRPLQSAVPNSSPDLEILDVRAKVMEENDVWWRWSYQLKARNNTLIPSDKLLHVEFLDAEGYIIDDSPCPVKLAAGETKTFLGTALIDVPGGARVKSVKAE